MMELNHYDFYIDSNGVVYYDSGIVVNDGNPLYQAYEEWLEEGNTPEPWEPEENA